MPTREPLRGQLCPDPRSLARVPGAFPEDRLEGTGAQGPPRPALREAGVNPASETHRLLRKTNLCLPSLAGRRFTSGGRVTAHISLCQEHLAEKVAQNKGQTDPEDLVSTFATDSVRNFLISRCLPIF